MSAKLTHHIAHIQLPASRTTGQHHRPHPAPRINQCLRRIRSVTQDQRHITRRLRQLSCQRNVQPPRHHNPRRLPHHSQIAHRQARIIAAYSAAAHHHCIMAGTHAMHQTPRATLRDPLALTRCRGNAPVKR